HPPHTTSTPLPYTTPFRSRAHHAQRASPHRLRRHPRADPQRHHRKRRRAAHGAGEAGSPVPLRDRHGGAGASGGGAPVGREPTGDRKSTRLNSSHQIISYA